MKNELLKFLKKYEFKGIILRNIIILFLVLSVSMAVFALAACIVGVKSIKRDVIISNTETAQRLNASTETIFRNIEYLCAEMNANTDINTFMSASNEDLVYKDLKVRLTENIRAYQVGQGNIESVYLYSYSNNLVCDYQDFTDIDEFADRLWLDECKDWEKGDYKIISRTMPNKYGTFLTFLKKTANKNGIIAVNIDTRKLKKQVIERENGEFLFYIIKDGKKLYGNSSLMGVSENELLDSAYKNTNSLVKKNGRLYSVNTFFSTYYNWQYVCIKSCDKYINYLNKVYLIAAFVFIFVFILASVLSMLLSKSRMNEFIILNNILDRKQVDAIKEKNEMSEIADKIAYLIEDNDDLRNMLNEKIDEYENIKIKALQSQINSHFMNNTLAVINGEIIAAEGYNSNAGNMIIMLSQIIKYGFILDEVFVTLDEEIRFNEMYVKILKKRYGDFEYTVSVQEAAKTMPVPRMSIQVLIENAVFHGISRGGDFIGIDCISDGNALTIKVRNNGYDMSEVEQAEIFGSLNDESFTEKKIGIRNLYRRLKLLYKNRAEMSIECKNGYTEVTVKILNS